MIKHLLFVALFFCMLQPVAAAEKQVKGSKYGLSKSAGKYGDQSNLIAEQKKKKIFDEAKTCGKGLVTELKEDQKCWVLCNPTETIGDACKANRHGCYEGCQEQVGILKKQQIQENISKFVTSKKEDLKCENGAAIAPLMIGAEKGVNCHSVCENLCGEEEKTKKDCTNTCNNARECGNASSQEVLFPILEKKEGEKKEVKNCETVCEEKAICKEGENCPCKDQDSCKLFCNQTVNKKKEENKESKAKLQEKIGKVLSGTVVESMCATGMQKITNTTIDTTWETSCQEGCAIFFAGKHDIIKNACVTECNEEGHCGC